MVCVLVAEGEKMQTALARWCGDEHDEEDRLGVGGLSVHGEIALVPYSTRILVMGLDLMRTFASRPARRDRKRATGVLRVC